MARRITETHYCFNRYAVWIEVGGTHYRAELRAWAIDDSPEGNESDVWWALCNWHDGHGQASIEFTSRPLRAVRAVNSNQYADDR